METKCSNPKFKKGSIVCYFESLGIVVNNTQWQELRFTYIILLTSTSRKQVGEVLKEHTKYFSEYGN